MFPSNGPRPTYVAGGCCVQIHSRDLHVPQPSGRMVLVFQPLHPPGDDHKSPGTERTTINKNASASQGLLNLFGWLQVR